jgi:hypothetical protein
MYSYQNVLKEYNSTVSKIFYSFAFINFGDRPRFYFAHAAYPAQLLARQSQGVTFFITTTDITFHAVVDD